MRRANASAAVAFAALGGVATAQVFDGALPRALCAGWRGEATCERLHEDEMIRVLRCTFAPGVGHEPHYHPPHFGYVLEGESVMRITTAQGVSDRPVQAGDAFANDVEVRHQAFNAGTESTRYLIVEKKYADTRDPDQTPPGLCPSADASR